MAKQNSFLPRANDWGVARVWNLVLGNKPERPAKERGYLWASELGKAPIEVFLKMRGVEPSNPPDQRSKRKFVSGNFHERLVGYVLKVCGIYKEEQKWVNYQYPGLLEVTGRIDFIAGGIPDYDTWKEKLTEAEKYLIQDFMEPIEAIINNFREKYPEGLADLCLEVKSCSVFMMNALEATGKSSKNHRLQLFHYLKSENRPKGLVVYICRDDDRMYEVVVQNPSDIEDEYRRAIEEITGYYEAHKKTPINKILVKPDSADVLKWDYNPEGLEGLPPLEKNIVWDEDLGKFSRNWGVEYSSYLSMLYGFASQREFEEAVNPTVGKWNRVMRRIKTEQARAKWLAEQGVSENDVQSELVVVEGKRNRQRVQFIMKDDQKVLVPDEIKSGYEMKPETLVVIEEMVAAGFTPHELAAKFADEKEEEPE